MLSIIHTVAGTRIDHGGPSKSVPELCTALATQLTKVSLLASKPSDPRIKITRPSLEVTVHWVCESAVSRQWGPRNRFRRGLRQALDQYTTNSITLVHDHGVWLANNHAIASETKKLGIPRIVSPRGTLSDWAIQNKYWKKRIAWQIYQKRDLQSATAFHATSTKEAENIRALGFRQPIAVVPNGISLPSEMPKKFRADGFRRVLFLSRIHPVKGLLTLLHAWKHVPIRNTWRLVIAGPDSDGHQAQVAQLANELSLTDQVEFAGPVSDAQKWSFYRGADIFVLPSLSENFGIVVAEALAAELPVITTTAAPWAKLAELGFGRQVDSSAESLAEGLVDLMERTDSERAEMGVAAAQWATHEFQWRRVAERLQDFYVWLLSGGDKPDFVLN